MTVMSTVIPDPPDFECYDCGHQITKIASIDPELTKCPICGSINVLDLHEQKFEENIPESAGPGPLGKKN